MQQPKGTESLDRGQARTDRPGKAQADRSLPDRPEPHPTASSPIESHAPACGEGFPPLRDRLISECTFLGRSVRLYVDEHAKVVLHIAGGDGDGVRLVLGESEVPSLDDLETVISIGLQEVSAREREIRFQRDPKYRSIVRAQARAARGGKEVA